MTRDLVLIFNSDEVNSVVSLVLCKILTIYKWVKFPTNIPPIVAGKTGQL